MTIWRMCITPWVPKAENTYSEYVIFIVFLLQQWLDERTSLLRCTDITCLVRLNKALCIAGLFPC
jgi:hypothetical protein